MANIILFDRNIILRADGSLPSESDLEKFRTNDKDAFYFEEKQFGLHVLGLSSACEIENNDHFKMIMLREYYNVHSEEENFLAFRAKALLNWYKTEKFCGSCGAELKNHEKLTARECPSCKRIIFPRIEPCVIVLVNKGDKILLARHTYRNQDIYACIAGFMEAGESAEEAVRRELYEETGIKVKNLVYRGSQSWPFPDQLMLGFTAEWESGELKLQPEEIADAQWFDPENCPASPKPGSIAYRLIHKMY